LGNFLNNESKRFGPPLELHWTIIKEGVVKSRRFSPHVPEVIKKVPLLAGNQQGQGINGIR
jgi:hypothetical protein